MKTIFTLFTGCLLVFHSGNAQVLLNELYTDPGAGKHEFFELYNSSASPTPASMDNYTLLCFFDISGQTGWYVMDLPNIPVAPKGYFVGSAALPFNYQGVTASTASDFSWNSLAFVANNGYVKKWVPGTANLTDGNLYYDQAAVPANFNDFLFRRTSMGASYSVFLYANGVLVNTFIGGTGGSSTIINDIINMPQLYIDMTAASPDFTIDFSGYGTLPVESTTQNAGSDNGYIREADGACAHWVKSSAQIQHTPKLTNGTLSGSSGSISVASAISRGTAASGSVVNYNVVSGPASAFPIEMQVYVDNGTIVGQLDPTDTYVASNTETIISQGPFYTQFFPYTASVLIVVKTNAGCLDKIQFIPNAALLSVNLISFQGDQTKSDITLKWLVEKNETMDRFEVEKSTDGNNFTATGTVFSSEKAGQEEYSFPGKLPIAGEIIYRLKIVDKTGKSVYSKTLVFESNPVTNNSFKIINNPVNDRLTVSFQSCDNHPADLKIVDIAGRVVQQQTLNISKGSNIIGLPLSSTFNKGLYIVDFFDGIKHYTNKFIKQ